MKAGPHWWTGDPKVIACEACGCPIQRTLKGTVADGLRAHVKTVHPGFKVVDGPVPVGAS